MIKEISQRAKDRYEILRDNAIAFMNEHLDTEIRRNLASLREAERRQDKRAYDAMRAKFDRVSARYGSD